MADTSRVILLIDIDCFYCQVEEKLNPNLREKPLAVVQFNTWREGGIIAANYLAREKGVAKGLWCYEAKEKCPEILFATVSEVRGRADLTKYREAGKEVFDVLQKYTTILEKASVDEAYLDVTDTVDKKLQDGFEQVDLNRKISRTRVVGYNIEDYLENLSDNSEFSEGNLRLAVGALISDEIRADISLKTGYKCSAGIAHNKMLAKLASGLHKPNAQTIFPQEVVSNFFNELPIQKIKGLGGKFGKSIAEELAISNIGQVTKFSQKELVKRFEEKTGKWLYNIVRGIDLEPVKTRIISKSIGCCKRFPGKNCLVSPGSVERWINELATEVSERLEKEMDENNRKAKQMVFSFTQILDEKHITNSKSLILTSYEQSKIARDFFQIINKSCRKSDSNYNNITFLGLSAGNFENMKNTSDITTFLKKISDHKPSSQKNDPVEQKANTDSFQMCNDTNSDYIEKTEINHNIDDTIEKLDRVDSICGQNMENDLLFRKQDTLFDNQALSNQSNGIDIESSSFFNKYFMNFKKSKFESEDLIDEKNIVPDSGSDNDHLKSENTSSIKICPECNEDILASDFILHMDYHFASKVQTNNSCLQCNQRGDNNTCKKCQSFQTNMPPNTEDINTSKRKRKADNTPSVITFFRKFEELNEDNSKYCQECNKRIKLKDVVNHGDYHTALQIHYQLNSNSSQILNKSKSKKGSGSILSFFKNT